LARRRIQDRLCHLEDPEDRRLSRMAQAVLSDQYLWLEEGIVAS
jgi:hypothetical protein